MLERVFERSEIGGLGGEKSKGQANGSPFESFSGADALMQDELSLGKSNQTPYQEEARGPSCEVPGETRGENRESRKRRPGGALIGTSKQSRLLMYPLLARPSLRASE